MENNNIENINPRRAVMEFVPIDKILPNPHNPRKDHAARTEELQRIIQNHGWEEGLTVYKKGNYYILMSGHRRWHAARQLGVKEVPIFIVPAPANAQEEVERIASLQMAHEEWSVFEWAKFCYETWVYWKKPKYKEFSKIINMPVDKITEYIDVFESYPREEIEDKLEKKVYSIRALHNLSKWMRKFQQVKPGLYDGLTGDMIRRTMLRKVEKKRADPNALKGDKFIEVATDEQVKEFLFTADMSLREAQNIVGVTKFGDKGNWHSSIMRVSTITRDLPNIKPQNKDQAENLYRYLTNLEEEVKGKIKELDEKFSVAK